jgi:hypothetical protein
VLQGKPLSEQERKAELVKDYVEKYAAIAGRAITPMVFDLYVEALADIDERRLAKGLKRYLREGTAWAWPGQLREFCEEEI